MRSGLPWARNSTGTPSTVTLLHRLPSVSRTARTGAALANAVFGGDHDAVLRRVGEHVLIERFDAAHVPQGDVDALGGQGIDGLLGGADQLAHRQDADRFVGRLAKLQRLETGT